MVKQTAPQKSTVTSVQQLQINGHCFGFRTRTHKLEPPTLNGVKKEYNVKVTLNGIHLKFYT